MNGSFRRFSPAITCVLTFAIAFVVARPLAAQGTPTFHLAPCADTAVYPDAHCGTLTVFENRAAKSGRQISLNVAVLPALNAAHASDPVFILTGGPGGAVVGQYMKRKPTNLIASIRAKRDIVLVDQRGTGGSHSLPCAFFQASAGVQPYFDTAVSADRVRECRDALSNDADLTQYSTPIAMDDLDDVRAALSYGRINLYGLSYGTRAALVYLRQHPTHVRTAILDGVAPPGDKHPLPEARGTQHALDRLIDDCAADAHCHEAYPDVRGDVDAILASLTKAPAQVHVLNPTTKQREPVELTRDSFVRRLNIFLSSTASASVLPSLFHRGARGDLTALIDATASAISQEEASVARGMWLSVVCAEDVQWITDDDIAKHTVGTLMGALGVESDRAVCKEWPRARITADYLKPVDSSVPVLLFSGDVDPVTPSWDADSAAKHLPNSRHVIIKYGGHGAVGACVDRLKEAFLDAGSTTSLDDSCINDIRRPAFSTAADLRSNPSSRTFR